MCIFLEQEWGKNTLKLGFKKYSIPYVTNKIATLQTMLFTLKNNQQ